MNGINRVLVAGHLGQDPECRATADGKWVANLSVATSRKRKDASGQTQEDTEWHRIVMWERNAELARQYLKKGAAIFVEGRLQTREWEDKEGRKRWSTEIVAERFQFLTSGRRDTEAQEDAPQSESGPARQPTSAPRTSSGPQAPARVQRGPQRKPMAAVADIPF